MSGFNLGDTSVKTTLKYGLNPAAKKKAKAKPLGGPIAAFAGGDDSDDDDAGERARANAEVLRQQAAARRDRQAEAVRAAALAQDATVFDYDGHVDAHLSDRRAKLAAADAERVDRKSRYVEALAAKQKERDREAAMVRERRLLREREREDHLYADKEKFVTAAYRAKLEADAKWIREDAARDAAEAADDVAKKSDLSGFYGGFARAHLERRGEHPTTTTTPEATKKKTDEVGGGAGSAEGAARDPTRGASAAAKAKAAAEEEGRARRAAAEALRAKTPSEETRKGSETAPTPKADAAPGAPDAKALAAEKAAAARERYLARKRKQGHDGS